MESYKLTKCACGCGELRTKLDKKGRERKFIMGHGGIKFKKGIIPKTAFKKGIIPWNKNTKGIIKNNRKGMDYEEQYGAEKSKKIKEKMRLIKLGKESSRKGKTYEEIYGEEKAIELINKKRLELDIKEISNLYINHNKSTRDIAEIFGTNQGTIIERLIEKGIVRRWKGVKVNCKVCGKEFKKKPNHFNRSDNHFCSRKCWSIGHILPVKDTKIELKIQNFLKQLGIEFFTHQYMHIEHKYQCDILIPSMNIVIECDGDYWHKYPIGNDIDHIRTKELLEKGFKVLRLWEFEINRMTIDKFKGRIDNAK